MTSQYEHDLVTKYENYMNLPSKFNLLYLARTLLMQLTNDSML
jgi:hypothetical protein